MSKLLITGGAGFIGTNLVYYMYNVGNWDEIRVLDNFSAGSQDEVSELKTVNVIEGSVTNKPVVRDALRGITHVVHLAAMPGIENVENNPKESAKVNIMGTENVFESAWFAAVLDHEPIQRIIFASSNAVLAGHDPPMSEKMEPKPQSLYGEQKQHGEELVKRYNNINRGGIDYITLRFSNVYGPFSLHKTSVVSSFMRNIANKEPAVIHGIGQQTRDFIYTDDLCRAIDMVLSHNDPSALYQVGTGRETSINELAMKVDWMLRDDSLTSDLKSWDPVEFINDLQKEDDSRNYSNIIRIKKELGWRPRFKMIEGLMRIWGYFYGEIVENS